MVNLFQIKLKTIREDEKILSESTESELGLTKYRPVSKEFGEEVTKNLDKELEDGIFNAYKTAQDEFTKMELKHQTLMIL